jgi:hypothetical protein
MFLLAVARCGNMRLIGRGLVGDVSDLGQALTSKSELQ